VYVRNGWDKRAFPLPPNINSSSLKPEKKEELCECQLAEDLRGGGLLSPDTGHLGSPSLVTQHNQKEGERVLSRKKQIISFFSSHNSEEQQPHVILEV